MAYALFATAYTYGTSGSAVKCSDRSESGIKAFLEKYADPGEQLRYKYSSGTHSIVFLGENDDGTGFYYISYNGGKKSAASNGDSLHDLYVSYQSYKTFADEVTTSLTVRDTNGGSYFSNSAKSSADVRESENASSIVVRLDCPVDASVTLDGVILSSEGLESGETASAEFGTVERDGDSIIFTLDYSEDYEFAIWGTDDGTMDIYVDYYAEDEILSSRTLIGVDIAESTEIATSSFDTLGNFVLYISDSDVGTTETWGAAVNETVSAADDDYSSENNSSGDDSAALPTVTVSTRAGSSRITATFGADGNGYDVTGYTIVLKLGDTELETRTADTAGSVTFTGLTSGTEYTVEVTATNAAGSATATVTATPKSGGKAGIEQIIASNATGGDYDSDLDYNDDGKNDLLDILSILYDEEETAEASESEETEAAAEALA